jgi:phytoene desaturase
MGNVAVIGAGFGGLSAAIRLASSGYDVDLYEKQGFSGGKAGNLQLQGYRFDTGPSLLTMIPVFRDLFKAAGADFDERVRIVPLEPLCNYFYPDGTRLRSYNDIERFTDEIRNNIGEPEDSLTRFLEHSRKIYSTAAWLFLEHSLHDIGTYTKARAWRSLLNLYKIDPFRTLDKANSSFFSDPRLVQLFDRYATYNGSSPYQAPATFNIISHVEYALGGYAVEGGIFAISKALEQLALEKGVHIYLENNVDRIITGDGRVRGISVGGGEIGYDTVISNVDVLHTYDKLLEMPRARWRRRYARLEPSSSGLVFYWGMDRSFPELGVHNIFFSPDYKSEFNQIFQQNQVPDDPTVYINITSKIDHEDAPRKGENWFILINVPHDSGHNWRDESAKVRKAIVRRLSHALGSEIERHIAAEQIMTPPDIERNTNSTYGSLYGIASNNIFAAFRRHPNRVRKPAGLYFCGGSSHPGGGMPLAILSGKITAELVRKYETI